MNRLKQFIPCSRCEGKGRLSNPAFWGAVLRSNRVLAGKTQTEVAKKLGITKGYLSDLELGRRAWSPSLIDRYEKAVNHD